MSLKVGVIGVGYLGRHHASIYSAIEDAELVAVVDTDKERAATFAQKYGCAAYSDFRAILPQVDALSIVTPTLSHYMTPLLLIPLKFSSEMSSSNLILNLK